LLLFFLFADLLFLELFVAALFFSSDLFSLGSDFFQLTLSKKLNVFLLKLFVHPSFVNLILFAGLFLYDLTIEFLLYKSAALLLPHNGLLLLLVVK
jgi:hypothetical protein